MTSLRILCLSAAIVAPGLARAGGPWPDPWPIAPEATAFRAPEEVSPETSGEPPPVSEPAGPLALQDALALALLGNPELAAFSWEVRASEARRLQAGRLPNPEVDVRVYRLGIERAPERQDEARSRVVLSQLFELGAKRRRRVDLARTERDLAGLDYELKRIEVATTVAARFVELLGAQRSVETWRQVVADFDETRDKVRGLVEAGVLRRVEIPQIERRLGLVRLELHRAENELPAARIRLAASWGSSSPRFTEVVGDLERVPPLPALEDALELARQGPNAARGEAELARSQAALDLARSRRVPDLTYGVGIRWEDDLPGRDYLVDLEIALPVFDRKTAEVRAARYDLARTRAARQAAEIATHQAIVEAYHELAAGDARRATLSAEVLPAARQTFDAHRIGFGGQAGNVDDLLDARQDLARAEVLYVESLVDCHRALAWLEGLVGGSLGGSE